MPYSDFFISTDKIFHRNAVQDFSSRLKIDSYIRHISPSRPITHRQLVDSISIHSDSAGGVPNRRRKQMETRRLEIIISAIPKYCL
jgi:hypothetical protein